MSDRILIVEDDDVQAFTLRAALESAGYTVDAATDGIQSVKKLCTQAYALALIDFQIPEIDGLTSMRLARQLLGDAAPRFVAMTSSPDALHDKLDQGNPFHLIIPKPYQLVEVIGCVERLVPYRQGPQRFDRSGAAAATFGLVRPRSSQPSPAPLPAMRPEPRAGEVTLERNGVYLRNDGRHLKVMKFEGAYVHYVADDNGNFRSWDLRCWRIEQKSRLLSMIIRQTS